MEGRDSALLGRYIFPVREDCAHRMDPAGTGVGEEEVGDANPGDSAGRGQVGAERRDRCARWLVLLLPLPHVLLLLLLLQPGRRLRDG